MTFFCAARSATFNARSARCVNFRHETRANPLPYARINYKAAFVLAAATLIATGCNSIGRSTFAAPSVRLRDVAVTGLGFQGGSVDVHLSVYNPNHYKLDAVKMTYFVDIDSTKLGEGQLEDRFVVQPSDSADVRLPVKFTYTGLGAAGASLLKSGSVNYRVRGSFTVSTPLGNFTRPYDQKRSYNTVTGKSR